MPDREDDDDRRPAGAIFPGAAGEAGRAAGADSGHAGAKGLGDPAAAKGLGDPGGAKGLGDPGGAKGLGDPGGAKGLGDPGGAKGLGDPGGAKGLGDPGGAKGLGDPSVGPGGAKGLGNPSIAPPGNGPPGYVPPSGTPPGYAPQGFTPPGYAPPGYAPPSVAPPGYAPPSVAPPGYAPPSFAPPGARLSIKGVLVSVAVIVAVIVAAIAAFLVLRPDPPRQTADEQSLGTAATPSDGATPGIAASSEALFRGTYSSQVTVTSSAGTTTKNNVGTAVSDCPHCDVTLSGSGGATVFHWNGSVWEHITEGPTCAGDSVTFTPTVVADGFVQELDYYYATCNGTVSTGTMTRTGD
ncbi:hypothetical protein MGALJ_03190 [Mycobacterium gallinarum]|uniref:Uncharacterized protein n=1 Tax=Mycobacterium gallinarum TaxID=39689 RepID=A0A9W4B446_9MYCO|nr:hypothetical protein [Mycobacterium gallinarum]BBY90650.1 hypothetical protein MGALJ_03190 [Mycobacterium gallinarum]